MAADVDVYGKTVSELQTTLDVFDSDPYYGEPNTGGITGTLHEVTGYTGFSGDVEKQSGYFIALEVRSDFASDAVLQVELLGGESEGHPVTLDSDRIIVGRITSTTQSIKLTATKGTRTAVKTYSLAALELE